MTEQTDLDAIRQAIQAGPGNISLTALLQALMPTLSDEARETVRQALAAQEARRVNRGLTIGLPELVDDIDPTNQKWASVMHKHADFLFPYGIHNSSLAGYSADRTQFVVVARDLVTAYRRELLAIIIEDFLGDKPALSLAPELAGDETVKGSGLFVFANNKPMPHPISEKNLQRMIDYFELADPELWTFEFWQEADERSRQVSHWLATEQKGVQS